MGEHQTLRSANAARQAEWDQDNKITLAYRGNELAGEVGEACNVIKKLERERLGIRGSRDTVEHLAEELADVVICADLIAMSEGIDLDAAVTAKFNATSEKVGLATRLVPDRHRATIAVLVGQLTVARTMLEGYAEHDDEIGHYDDAHYTRQRIAEIDSALQLARGEKEDV